MQTAAGARAKERAIERSARRGAGGASRRGLRRRRGEEENSLRILSRRRILSATRPRVGTRRRRGGDVSCGERASAPCVRDFEETPRRCAPGKCSSRAVSRGFSGRRWCALQATGRVLLFRPRSPVSVRVLGVSRCTLPIFSRGASNRRSRGRRRHFSGDPTALFRSRAAVVRSADNTRRSLVRARSLRLAQRPPPAPLDPLCALSASLLRAPCPSVASPARAAAPAASFAQSRVFTMSSPSAVEVDAYKVGDSRTSSGTRAPWTRPRRR